MVWPVQGIVTIELDQHVDAAYIRLSTQPVATTRELTGAVLVDLDAMGVVVGVEVLSLDADIPFDRLVTDCHVYSDVVDLLRTIRPTVRNFVISSGSEASSSASRCRVGDRDLVTA